jgi:CBS domain-containing protein
MAPLARDVMQRNVGIIDASASLAELESAFDDAGVSGFPVVGAGRVVGIVSRTDVVRALAPKEERPQLSNFYAELDRFGGASETESLADLAARHGRSPGDVRVGDVMTTDVLSVASDAEVAEVAQILVEHGVHRVLVIDGSTLVGVVSSLDLARLVADGTLRAA